MEDEVLRRLCVLVNFGAPATGLQKVLAKASSKLIEGRAIVQDELVLPGFGFHGGKEGEQVLVNVVASNLAALGRLELAVSTSRTVDPELAAHEVEVIPPQHR